MRNRKNSASLFNIDLSCWSNLCLFCWDLYDSDINCRCY